MWGCSSQAPPLALDAAPAIYLGPNYGGGNEWCPPSKDPMHILLQSVPPTLQQATTDPCLCLRLLDTYRQVWEKYVNIIITQYSVDMSLSKLWDW